MKEQNLNTTQKAIIISQLIGNASENFQYRELEGSRLLVLNTENGKYIVLTEEKRKDIHTRLFFSKSYLLS